MTIFSIKFTQAFPLIENKFKIFNFYEKKQKFYFLFLDKFLIILHNFIFNYFLFLDKFLFLKNYK